MGRALEAALARLQEFDAAHPRSGASAQQARRTLVMEAGHALWMFVVQRDAWGLRHSRTVMRDYNVPNELQQCMGAAPATSMRAATCLTEFQQPIEVRDGPEAALDAFRAVTGPAPGPRCRFPGQNESTALPDLSRIVTQVAAKGRARGGASPGVSMSGHLRFCFAAFVLLAGLWVSPASSNPFADLFNVAPRQTPAPAPAERSACRGPASRRPPASAGSIVWKATANAGSRPLRRSR